MQQKNNIMIFVIESLLGLNKQEKNKTIKEIEKMNYK